MEQLRCPKCNHRLLDIDAVRYRVKTRCRNCKGWCLFDSKDAGSGRVMGDYGGVSGKSGA